MNGFEVTAGAILMMGVAWLAFVIPGWVGATLLVVRGRWCATFVVGPVVLFWSLMIATSLGFGVRFAPVLVLQCIVTGAFLLVLFRRCGLQEGLQSVMPSRVSCPEDVPSGSWILVGAILLVNFKKWRISIFYIVPAVAVFCGLYFCLVYGGIDKSKFFNFYPGLSAKGGLLAWLKMWWLIFGIAIPLAVASAIIFWKQFNNYAKTIIPATALLFAVANIILFQPVAWDNSKILVRDHDTYYYNSNSNNSLSFPQCSFRAG